MTGLVRKPANPGPKRKRKKLTSNERRLKGLRPLLPGEKGLDIERALNLRLAGMTYDQIGKTLNINPKKASQWIQDAIYSRVKEPSDQIRQIEIQRLDAMLLSLATKVRAGDVQAIDRALKIMERRARLLGLDMAEKKDIGGTVEFQWRIDERQTYGSDPTAEVIS